MNTAGRIATGLLLVAFVNGCVSRRGPDPAAAVLLRTEMAVGAMATQEWVREKAAEAMAARFLQGGSLWVAGSIPRFDIEWLNRAGGVMPVAVVRDPATIGTGDVLLFGCLDGNDSQDAQYLTPIHDRGAFVIAFGTRSLCPRTRAVADAFITNCLPPGTPMQKQVGASMSMAQLWALTADFIGACTRAGAMPTMWQSVMVEGARDRNAKYRANRVHADMTIPPQKPGTLGAAYLDAIGASLRALRSQRHAIERAGRALRRAVANEHRVYHANLGHFEPVRLVPNDFSVPMTRLERLKEAADLRVRGKRGDVLLCVWYTEMPTALLQAARDRGVTSICMVASNPEHPIDSRLADIFIDPQWRFGDAAVTLPGYDVRILPPSGVLNSVVFWAILAEAEGE